MPLARLSRAGVAILLLAAAPLQAAPKATFAEEPKGDKRYFVEIPQLLPYRDGVLGLGPGLRFLKYDSKAAERFPVAGIDDVTSIAQVGGSVLFLGVGEKGDFVLAEEEPGKTLRPVPLPPEVREQKLDPLKGVIFPHLLASSRLKALIHDQTVWWLDGETWKSRKLPKVPKFYEEFEPTELGSRRYLLGETLFIGWDQGEWGGMLASIDLKDEKATWIHLSGKKQGDSTGIPENQPVQKILSTDGKSLWVAMGLAHLGLLNSDLSCRAADGRWSHPVHGRFGEPQGPLALPQASWLASIAADSQGRIHLLASGAGIFRVEEKALDQVLDHSFAHSYETDSYMVGCYPIDMAITKQGDIFVSTNAFGILAFRKEGEAWQGRQILVKED